MKTLKTLASSVLTASFVFSPAALVLAEEAGTVAPVDATVSVTATTSVTSTGTAAPVPTLYKEVMEQKREELQRFAEQKKAEILRLGEQKREELKKLEEQKREGIKTLREETREGVKDLRGDFKDDRKELRASSTASSTAIREEMKKKLEEARKERREEMMKRQMASTTDKLSALSTKLAKLGVDIKAAVEAQASSSLVITSSMTAVEARSAFKTFLLGSDLKNLGQLVKEAANTQARINQIENKISTMASSSDKAALVASVEELKTQAASVEQYVKDNQSKFSLFGWLAKRFNK